MLILSKSLSNMDKHTTTNNNNKTTIETIKNKMCYRVCKNVSTSLRSSHCSSNEMAYSSHLYDNDNDMIVIVIVVVMIKAILVIV